MDLEKWNEEQHTGEEKETQKQEDKQEYKDEAKEDIREEDAKKEDVKKENVKEEETETSPVQTNVEEKASSAPMKVKKAGKNRGLIVKCAIVGGILVALLLLLAQQVIHIKQDNSGVMSKLSDVKTDHSSNGEKALQAETVTQEPTYEPGSSETVVPPVSSISPDSLYSAYAILMRVSDQAVLLDKNGSEKIYPASMTKIMTALVAIEQLPDLEEKITLTSEQINPLYEDGASMAGFCAGESVSVRDLLYGVMLPSGADACVALADRIAGSEQGFVELMNQKVQELGLVNTHFVTDSGLHDDNHYSTCADLAAILNYALKNDTFRMIFTSHDYVCEPTEYHPEGLYLSSTLFSKMESDTLENGAVIEGGKTGYTDEAQLCLASLAVIQGEEYILVTAHAEGNHYTDPYHILDARAVFAQIGT